MPASDGANAHLERLAREAIEASYGTQAGEYAATLFVTHHLGELPTDYWERHLESASPTPQQVLGLIERRPCIDDDELDDEEVVLDFGLPGGVSDYVLSVTFDDDGAIEGIAMES